MEWLGRAKIEYTHAPSPRTLRDKKGQESDLRKITEETTPPCNLNPLLFNGHLQTIWTTTKPAGPPIYYRRRVFQADLPEYEGTFAVDFVVPPHEENDPSLGRRTVNFTEEQFEAIGSDDSKPMLIVLHGLSGGSHEVYLRHVIAPMVGEGGWEACVVNSRGCAKSKLTTGVLYNARATWDCRQIVKWARKTFPNRPLFGMGFSLGANMMTNYCAEEGSNCLLKAAVVVSNPFNLDVTCKILQRTFLGRELYLRVMGSAMKNVIETNRPEIEKFTDLDMKTIENVTYLQEFDRAVQCRLWGYPTEDAYYRDASSADGIVSIRIPFLAVSATDDPIAVKEAIPYEEFKQNPNTMLLTTSMGGHLCWFETGGSRWHGRAIPNWLNHLAFEIDLDSVKPDQEPRTSGKAPRGAMYDPLRRKMGLAALKAEGLN